jgi:hypothetical protein
MKKLFALAVSAAVFAVPASQAVAATGPTAAQFKALQKQVTTLQKQVKALQKKVTDANDLALAVGAYSICQFANTADALQGTWQAVDQREQSQGRQPVFGAQTPISDANLCLQGFNVARSHSVPPNVGAFTALNTAFGITALDYSALALLER